MTKHLNKVHELLILVDGRLAWACRYGTTGVHPESYALADAVLAKFSVSRRHVGTDAARTALRGVADGVGGSTTATDLDTDPATLKQVVTVRTSSRPHLRVHLLTPAPIKVEPPPHQENGTCVGSSSLCVILSCGASHTACFLDLSRI